MAIRASTLLIISIQTVTAVMKLQELFSWNVLDWAYPDDHSKTLAIQVESLIPENAIPIGIEKWRNKLFVTVPRWVGGVPATLNFIPLDTPYEPSPKLLPYPSFEGNELGNCNNGLNTVYRIKADKCDRLWVLDVGTFGYEPNITRICPYTLYVYDLNSDQRIRKYIFKSEDISGSSLITNIVLDTSIDCEEAFAYFSDELAYGLIVYSWKENKSWRFTHSYFMPDPLLGNYNVSGFEFHWGNEGIYSLTLSPLNEDGYKTLYFSPLSSHTEFSVSTQILRNESRVKKSFNDFKIVGFRGPGGHTTAKCMDDSGVQLFGMVDQNSIACWSSLTSYNPKNFVTVARDDINLIFPSDIKIDDDKTVWVISNRMPLFMESMLDYSDINFRIFIAPLNTLLEGTACESPIQSYSNLGRHSIKPPSHNERKPKSLPVVLSTQRPPIPAGIHIPRFYNTSNILNFSIIVSSKTVHYVPHSLTTDIPSHFKSTNDRATPKMIIYVNSSDFNDIPTVKYEKVKYTNNVNSLLQVKNKNTVIPKMTSFTKKNYLTTNRITAVPYINKKQIQSFPNVSSPPMKSTAFFLNNINSIHSPKTPKMFNYQNLALLPKKIEEPKFKTKVFANLPTAPITNNKNNPYLNKTSFINAPIILINDENDITTTPTYEDEDYQTETVKNFAPTVNNYGNEVWYIGNMSKPDPYLFTNNSLVEDDNSYVEPTVQDLPTVVNNIRKTQNSNRMIKHKPKVQVHHPNRREEPKNHSHNANAVIPYVSSPTAFPKRVNFINAAYVHDETVKKFNSENFRPASPIIKRITNTNFYLAPKKSVPIKGAKANYNIKVNVLYPTTTVNTTAQHPMK